MRNKLFKRQAWLNTGKAIYQLYRSDVSLESGNIGALNRISQAELNHPESSIGNTISSAAGAARAFLPERKWG